MVKVSICTRMEVDGKLIKSVWPTKFSKDIQLQEPLEIADLDYYLFGIFQAWVSVLLEELTQACYAPKNNPGISLEFENYPCNTDGRTDFEDVD